MSEEHLDRSLTYAQDLEFIKWVQSGFRYKNAYWQSMRSDANLTSDIEAAIDLVKAMQFPSEESSEERKKDLFRRIQSSIENEEPLVKPNRTRIRVLIPISIAASLALMILFFWPSSTYQTIHTDLAEQSDHRLPDNSVLVLNADSEISYDKEKFNNQRILDLKGEAFFEVQKGSSFLVRTELGNVEVLGTSFNVYARDNSLEVVCETGKVRVRNTLRNGSIVLTPGKSCRFVNGELDSEDLATASDWRNGVFNFKDVKLSRVIGELERQYDIEIEIEKDAAELMYTGFFEIGNIDKALESVLWPLELEYSKTSDKIKVE